MTLKEFNPKFRSNSAARRRGNSPVLFVTIGSDEFASRSYNLYSVDVRIVDDDMTSRNLYWYMPMHAIWPACKVAL